ncbi:thiamine-phosphate kinase [Sphingomonas sp. IC4-52]|uniref:thiamine-phosphate kinase n=1 Tax=Sphingomonas sp. IC4-52 TaxID=2887202 RepID=UPI001D120215|nr:thiamine-phosphate kinase [Sphingomonas sp. IC4-52]MCC2980543.1 thiamine-phosphate kinase [Sphingomonas sp. IC4-52]
MTEAEFIAALRRLPLHKGALGLGDDAARLGAFVVTTDTLVEGVHFLPDDPAGDVAWKLVAVSLSDLAGKGAVPEGVLLNYPLSKGGWDRAFLAGLNACLSVFNCPLIGGDTVSLPQGAPRVLTVTAFGRDAVAPARAGAQAGDGLWVTGTIGDAGAGLSVARSGKGPEALLAAYRRPRPRLAEGRVLAPLAHAMMDVSDGLLIDAWRMAVASGLAVTIALDAVPLSAAYRNFVGDDPLPAVTAGDDYQLLCALPQDQRPTGHATCIGTFAPGTGLSLTLHGAPVPLPRRLGFEHRA